MLPDLRFHCAVLKININQHHRHTETKTIAHGYKSKTKRKSILGFPLEYYSNISPPIINIFIHLACFICVLLINCGFTFDVCVTVHHWYNNINSQLDGDNNNFINNFYQLNMFRAIISPILRITRLCLQLVVQCTDDATCCWPAGHLQAASSVFYTTSCKHSLVILRMGEIIARNMLSWLKLLIKLLLLQPVGCLYYCGF